MHLSRPTDQGDEYTCLTCSKKLIAAAVSYPEKSVTDEYRLLLTTAVVLLSTRSPRRDPLRSSCTNRTTEETIDRRFTLSES